MNQQSKKPAAEGELTEAALDQASGGALNAYTPAPANSAHGVAAAGVRASRRWAMAASRPTAR